MLLIIFNCVNAIQLIGMFKIIITKSNNNKPIWQYFADILIDRTKSSIKKDIISGDVKVNNKKVKDNYLLQTNDELTIYMNIATPNDNYRCCQLKPLIFYEDDNIILFYKQIGVLCQEDAYEKIRTMNNLIKVYAYNSQQWDGFDLLTEPALIHRLDQNTEGLLICAKNKNIAKRLNLAMTENKINKKYLTIVHNEPISKQMVLKDYIKKRENKNVMIVSSELLEHSKPITTHLKLIYTNRIYSILEVMIESGKKHQIRAHLAFHGMPIVGDYKYSTKGYDHKLQSQALVANEIIFNLDDDLSYLNGKTFKKFDLNNDANKIKFLQKFNLDRD